MRRSAGPWRSVIVPTMISRSAWRGEKRGNSAPKRAMSYFGAATDMYSIPQQAVTNGYENSENLRAQLTTSASLPVTKSTPIRLLPPDGALAPDVGEGDDQDRHEDEDLGEAEERDPRAAHAVLEGAQAGQRLVAQRPRVEERRLDVEHQEDDRHLVELDLGAGAGAADDLRAALVRVVLGAARPGGPEELRGGRQEQREDDPAEDHQGRWDVVRRHQCFCGLRSHGCSRF